MDSLSIPGPIQKFFSIFPLDVLPDQLASATPPFPTLWIRPPASKLSNQSRDVVCLKWQAYLVLRGVRGVQLRWDISDDGAINGRLPSLHLPNGDLLGSGRLPSWADDVQGSNVDPLEGFKNTDLKHESRAWASLLDRNIQAALPQNSENLSRLFQPPLPPLSGISNPLPPFGSHIPSSSILLQYREAIDSVAVRLDQDEWFLGSASPTFLDALLYAYLHCALQGPESLSNEILKRENLVNWEHKVSEMMESAYQ
ncbi:uncharacterized protein EI90DRAFT_490185 [Cantharellus anzutake]|uniref:uncharacterized protein n=1 Tax=Cantharellus anzutake TaxID=1750568 RepID=UPI0019057A2B|nr:uncharacterized protein EI90DRAFT_490185 [Cantharellus anzutake]KAF8333952.1 hypothetical protein EI90DRAFT_490185 [Cantharellus anzutake]